MYVLSPSGLSYVLSKLIQSPQIDTRIKAADVKDLIFLAMDNKG